MSSKTPAAAAAPGGRLKDRREAARRWATANTPADVLAAGAICLSGGLLLHWLSRLTFWRDEWGFLLHRRGWSLNTFLDPAVEHLVAIPILIYKLLLEIFGMDSPAPFQLVAVITFLASLVLVYLYVRPRAGAWLALAAILPILFLGPAWDDLLFPYQLTWFGSGACGIAALFCLERRSRGWDMAAMGLLCAGVLFSDAGIPFVAGALVEIAMGPDRFRRAYVALVPTLLWIVWYLGWGHTAQTFVSAHNLAQVPSYVLDGLSSSLAALLGLSNPAGGAAVGTASALEWGRPLLLAALVAVCWRIYRLGTPSPRLVATIVILLGFWALTGLNTSIFGLPTVGRYQYFGVVLLVLVAAELLRGVRIGPWVIAAVLAVSVAATASNVIRLKDAAAGLNGIAQQTRGGLAALELARDRVNPKLELTQENSGVDYIGLLDAGSYLSAVDAFGSPAYSPAELASAPEPGRIAADKVSATALGIALEPASAGGARCLVVHLNSGPAEAIVPREGFILRARGAGVQASLRRYASPPSPVDLGTLAADRPELLRIPADRSSQPWRLQLSGQGDLAVCRPGPSAP